MAPNPEGAVLARDKGTSVGQTHRVVVHRGQARSYAIWGFRWSEACPRISRLRNPVGTVLARDEGDADCLAHRGVLIASKLGS